MSNTATLPVQTEIPAEARATFYDLALRLSPEHLSMDGELSPREQERRRSAIMRQWHDLERRIGRKVSENEVYD